MQVCTGRSRRRSPQASKARDARRSRRAALAALNAAPPDRSVVHRGHTPSRASQLLAAPPRANRAARAPEPYEGAPAPRAAIVRRTTPRRAHSDAYETYKRRSGSPTPRGGRARADLVPGRVGRTVSFYEESNVAECPYKSLPCRRKNQNGRPRFNVIWRLLGRAARNVKYTSMSAVASR